MERLVKHKTFINKMGKKKDNVKIIKTCKNDELKLFCELCHNILRGTVPLSKDKLRKLKNIRNAVRRLSQKKVSFKKKRKILVQRGGFVASLLIPLLTTVASIAVSQL